MAQREGRSEGNALEGSTTQQTLEELRNDSSLPKAKSA